MSVVLLLLFVCFLGAPRAVALTSTSSDSTGSNTDGGAPDRPSGPVPYRSLAEQVAAVPGMVVYAPFHLTSYAAGVAFSAVWEHRILDRIKTWLTTADGRAGIRPLSNTHVGTGARLFYREVLAGGDLGFTYSRGQRHQRRNHTLSISDVRLAGLGGQWSLTGTLVTEPSESFYGIGNRSTPDDRTWYLQDDLGLRLAYQRRLSRVLELESELACHATEIRRGRYGAASSTVVQYADSALAGLGGRVGFAESTVAVRASFVDVPGSPTRGSVTLARVGYAHAVDGAGFSHLSLAIVSEQFRELFARRTLSLRLGTEWRAAPGNNEVPFYRLASVGGNLFVRGYRRGRLRDRGAAFCAGIYKFPVWKRLDGHLFYEAGRTFHGPGDVSLAHWKTSWGGGLRLWARRCLIFEQCFARSPEQTRLLFSLSTAF